MNHLTPRLPEAHPDGADLRPVSRRRVTFRVTGTVQGVGFRPFVHRLATRLGVCGWVGNDTCGVLGEAEGDPDVLQRFLDELALGPAPPAEVVGVAVEGLPTVDSSGNGVEGFEVRESSRFGGRAPTLAADVAPCAECLTELDAPGGRRHLDPFVSCSRCGPRWSVVTEVPWDRERTTVARFARCADCEREYLDPADRRYRAEASTCPRCGPVLAFFHLNHPVGTEAASGPAALDAAVAALAAGAIVAVKGLGGVHLAVDATDPAAVERLRRRKHRDDKPFAVVVADLVTARALCELDDETATLLASPAAPIVLCLRREHAEASPGSHVAEGVAPGRRELGLLLAPTPLHLLLARRMAVPLVLTSANLSDEPIVHRDDELDRLEGVADAVLTHDRPIATPVEDSVARVVAGAPQVLRRSRGYVPAPLPLPARPARPVLALGADLKSVCAVTTGDRAVLSAHVGDLHSAAGIDALERSADRLVALFGSAPGVVVHDLHPDYVSTRLAQRIAETHGANTLGVQHHHAHVAAVLAEHGHTGSALGVAYDGTGLGDDGTWWGGELLEIGPEGCRRVGHLEPVPMPGGGVAAREPWRMAAAHLDAAGAGPADPDASWSAAVAMARSRTNAPPTSSMGRLFDAVAFLVTGRRVASHEGQAAAELETLVVPSADPEDRYPLEDLLSTDAEGVVRMPSSAVVAWVAEDLRAGTDPARVAARVHHGIAAMTAHALQRLRDSTGTGTVALSGGVMQNRVLLESLVERLRALGFAVLVPRRVPPNDGGIAYGQLAVAVTDPRAHRG